MGNTKWHTSPLSQTTCGTITAPQGKGLMGAKWEVGASDGRQMLQSQHPLSYTDPPPTRPLGVARHPCPLDPGSGPGEGQVRVWQRMASGSLQKQSVGCRFTSAPRSSPPVASLRTTAARQIPDVGVTERRAGEVRRSHFFSVQVNYILPHEIMIVSISFIGIISTYDMPGTLCMYSLI